MMAARSTTVSVPGQKEARRWRNKRKTCASIWHVHAEY